MTVETDRRDARGNCCGLAGRPVHAKSASAQGRCTRCSLPASSSRASCSTSKAASAGCLRGFGLKVGTISRGRFEARIRDLVEGQAMLETVIGSMLAARAALQAEFARLRRALLVLVRADPVCRQLMSVPGALARSSPLPSGAGWTTRRASVAYAMSGFTLG